MKDIFTKVSSFYTRDTVTWEPKLCNIMVYRSDNEESIMIADKEIDMAPMVNHNDHHVTYSFDSDVIFGLKVDCYWTIVETTGEPDGRSSVASESVITAADISGSYSEEQINEFIENAKKLEEQKQELDSQLDLVLNAKRGLERLLKKEREETKQLKDKLAELENASPEEVGSEPVVEVSSVNTELNYLTTLLAESEKKTAAAREELDKVNKEAEEEQSRLKEEMEANINTHFEQVKGMQEELERIQAEKLQGMSGSEDLKKELEKKNQEISDLKRQLLEKQKESSRKSIVMPKNLVEDDMDDYQF